MPRKHTLVTLCLAALLLAAGCAPASAPAVAVAAQLPQASFESVPAQAKGDLVAANSRFAFDLLSALCREEAGENVFISPLSVSLALAMTYNGALGETQEAMASALALQGLSIEEVNRANAELLTALAEVDPEVQLHIANSLWARAGVPFRPEFIEADKGYYGAEVASIDFARGPGPINGWVKEQTRGRIESILDRLDPQAILVLVNAVYFQGPWKEPFNPQRTQPGPFHLPDGRTVTLPMMAQGGHYRYYEEEGLQAIRLPYGEGRVGLYIFLPGESSSLDEFMQGLSAEKWERWLAGFSGQQGSIALPRFGLEYEARLNDALTALGMGIAFDQDRADFHGLSPIAEPIWIGEVKHKTFLQVDEEGTEAAGATAVEVRAGSAAPETPFTMVVDRPFFCAIQDDQTGSILFLGSIVEPQ